MPTPVYSQQFTYTPQVSTLFTNMNCFSTCIFSSHSDKSSFSNAKQTQECAYSQHITSTPQVSSTIANTPFVSSSSLSALTRINYWIPLNFY